MERYNYEFVNDFIGKMTLIIYPQLELKLLSEYTLATIFPPSNQYWFKKFIIPVKNKWQKQSLEFKLLLYLINRNPLQILRNLFQYLN